MPEFKMKTLDWQEIPSDNPMVAKENIFGGYNVHRDLVNECSFSEYLLFMFRQCKKPEQWERTLFDKLAVSIANLGPRDPAIRASTCGGASHSIPTANLVAALTAGSGTYMGTAEAAILAQQFERLGCKLPEDNCDRWIDFLENSDSIVEQYFTHYADHILGFMNTEPVDDSVYIQMLNTLEECSKGWALSYLKNEYRRMEQHFNKALSPSFVIAAACNDLSIPYMMVEMLVGMLKLPGAVYHAAEQMHLTWKSYPRYSEGIKLREEVEMKPAPSIERFIRYE